jgi:DNA-binding GntR family transcriptional regulator
LVQGAFPPGSRLRDVPLGVELGVSRTPVREALVRLTHAGFLEADVGRGFTVRPLVARDVRNAYPILWTLECLALSLSPLPTKVRLAALDAINARMEGAASTTRRLALDAEWHRTLLSECPNDLLLAQIGGLKDFVEVYEYAYARQFPVHTSTEEHRAIVAALRRRDVPAALASLELNFRGTVERLLPWLEASDHQASPRRAPAERRSARA